MSSVPDCITAAGGGNVKFAAAASVFLKLARRNCLGERQILVGSTMGQEKPRRSIPPASCPLDGDVKGAGFWFAITHHLVVLNDQYHVMVTDTPEFLFQPRAIVTGFHIAALFQFPLIWQRHLHSRTGQNWPAVLRLGAR